jgi:dolichol-phosphate mannosyltransferase
VAEVTLSIMAPAHNEQENVRALVDEVGACGPRVARALGGGGFEFVLIDDGSTDGTRELALGLMPDRPWLRVIAMSDTPPGRGNGQSAAFHAGVRACRGAWIGMLDADLQNDPGDLEEMATLAVRTGADMVQGDRSRNRRDHAVRRVGSIVGRLFRRMILGDTIRDTGCSLRLMRREIGLRLPLEFKGAHRFIPVVARQCGYGVVEMPVRHRPRVAGETKYGMGVTKRAIPGLIDCFAVRWMRARRRPTGSREIAPPRGGPGAEPAPANTGAAEVGA